MKNTVIYAFSRELWNSDTIYKSLMPRECYSGFLRDIKINDKWGQNRPFRCDLNQIPYDCSVEVRNRQSAWWTMDGSSWHGTGDRDQDHLQEKEMKKAKGLSEEALQIAVKRREAKGKGEK